MPTTMPSDPAERRHQGPPEDTIAACATAIGGALAVLRISGPQALAHAGRLWQSRRGPLASLPPRVLHLGRVAVAGGAIDPQVLAVFMPGPHSYTGEDVVELHGHGGALATRLILVELLRLGCRHAEPGEFTRRAFVNGRLDLTQAEAVADLIGAHSEAALHLATRQLEGALGRRIGALEQGLSAVLAEVESRLDFPEEELEWQSRTELVAQLGQARTEATALLASRREGEVLREGIRLVIAGPPNVGKSSLLNAILGRDRAIVHELPGTTRDTLEEFVHIRGIPCRLVDTAGLRESQDAIENQGIARSRASLRLAAVVLWVYDASRPYPEQAWRPDLAQGTVILVGNKKDRLPGPPEPPVSGVPGVFTCALTGAGLEALFDAIAAAVWEVPRHGESEVAVSARHAALLERVLPQLADAGRQVSDEHFELAAVALRGALADLGRISGRTADPDILGLIFSRFCIGK